MASEGERLSASPSGTAEDQLDPAVLKGLEELGGSEDPEFVSGILTAFLTETPNQFVAIEAALVGGDAAVIAKCAHALKGSARGIGATKLVDLAFALEQKGRSGKVTAGKLLLVQIKAALEAVSVTVKKEISQRQAAAKK